MLIPYEFTLRSKVLNVFFQAAIRYRSTILRYIHMWFTWPLLLADFQHEAQTISVILFNDLLLEKVGACRCTGASVKSALAQSR